MVDAPEETLQRALALHRSGELQQAAELYERLLQLGASNPVLQHLAGTLRLQQREYLRAIEHLTVAVRLAPEDSQSHNNLGVAQQSLGQWESAARSFETTIKLDPANASALFNLAKVMSERGLHRDAVKCLHRAVEAEPENGELQLALIDELIADEDWATAEKLILSRQKTEAADTHQYDLTVRLALLHLQQGQLHEADRLYQQLLVRNPDDVEQLNNRAVACEQLGRFDAARETILQAVRLRPDLTEPRITLGIIERSLGNFHEALETWQQAAARCDSRQARLNLATTRLLLGQDGAGLAELPPGPGLPQPPGTEWSQGAPPEQRLLLIADREPAECLLFGRWIPLLRKLGVEHIAMAVAAGPDEPAAWRQLLQLDGTVDELIRWDQCHGWEAGWLPLSRLPAQLDRRAPGTAINWIDLVMADKATPPRPSEAAGLRAGLIWHSQPEQRPDNVRCCPTEWMERVLSLGCCDWTILSSPLAAGPEMQQSEPVLPVDSPDGLSTAERPPASDPPPRLTSVEAWILALRECDLIVGVDGPLLRSAAAWGCQTHVLLPKVPHWTWRIDDAIEAWYPRVQTYRQTELHDWQAPVEALCRQLQSLAAGLGRN